MVCRYAAVRSILRSQLRYLRSLHSPWAMPQGTYSGVAMASGKKGCQGAFLRRTAERKWGRLTGSLVQVAVRRLPHESALLSQQIPAHLQISAAHGLFFHSCHSHPITLLQSTWISWRNRVILPGSERETATVLLDCRNCLELGATLASRTSIVYLKV